MCVTVVFRGRIRTRVPTWLVLTVLMLLTGDFTENAHRGRAEWADEHKTQKVWTYAHLKVTAETFC